MDRAAEAGCLHRKISVKPKGTVIGITLGDPAGIGPEIIRKAIRRLGRSCTLRVLGSPEGIRPGVPSKKGAERARQALEESVRLLKAGEIHAVVNGPVSKEWLHRVGLRFPGQTEFYARRLGLAAGKVTMCLAGPRLRVALVTTHVSLRQAVGLLTVHGIIRAGEHLVRFLKKIGIPRPRIAVCGLNPHAGEGGMLGKEDLAKVLPAVRRLRKKTGLPFVGPVAADTAFVRALRGEFDGVVALYHDQGLIPAKLLDFDRTVNVTLGLPVVRCSPDHGTAFGLAGKGRANPGSMVEAVKLAVRLLGKGN